MKVRHGAKDKMLWVGDTISSNVNFKDISDKTQLEIIPVKAYHASKDNGVCLNSNENFLDVVEKQLNLHDFNYLVLGGGTEEITNLDTTSAPEKRLSEFKDVVFESSRKLFSIAEAALQTNPSLEKVILLRRPPRFDLLAADPLQVKPQLSRLGDAILFDLWCGSTLKEKIFLGDHQIPHQMDSSHPLVFGSPGLPSYDGLHMCGPAGRETFQQSILHILAKSGLVKPPQSRNIDRQVPHPVRNMNTSQRNNIPYNPMKILRERLAYQYFDFVEA